MVRSTSAPSVPIAVPGGDDALSQRHARAVTDLALRVAEALLATGESAADVVTTVLRLTRAYGVHSAHVDITFTSITVSLHRGLDEDPLSVMRVIRSRTSDHTRLEQVHQLVRDIVESTGAEGNGPGSGSGTEEHERGDRRPLPVEEARERLDRALDAPHPYRRWIATLGQSLIAGGVVALFGAGPVMMLLAGVTAAVVDLVSRQLSRAGIAAFFTQAVSAAIPTLVAVVVLALRSAGIELPGVGSPSLVVVAGIVVLLAGLTVMGAAQDALDGFLVTASARGLEVLVLTLGIAVGISFVLSTASRLGVPLEITADLGPSGALLPDTVAAAVIGLGFALSTYTGPRATAVATGTAAAAWLVYQSVGLMGVEQATAVGVAAAVAAAIGAVGQRLLRAPEQAVTTAAIVSLLPGLAVYRGLFGLVEEEGLGTAAAELLTAVSIGVGLAAGLSVGSFLAHRLLGPDPAYGAVRRARRPAPE